MAYDGPFDDERTCYHCGRYMKKTLSNCPNCGAVAGSGKFSGGNIKSWLIFAGVMAAIILPIMFLIAVTWP